MHSGRLLEFDCNISYPMHFNFIKCNTDEHNRNQVLHRGVVIPWILESTGYNSALAPKSDAYLPLVQYECKKPSKTSSSEQNWIADTTNNAIAEGRVKRIYTSNLPSVIGNGQTERDKYAEKSRHIPEEAPGTVG